MEIYYSKNHFELGGQGKIFVYRVVADRPEDFFEMFRRLRLKAAPHVERVRMVVPPRDLAGYKSKIWPHVTVRVECEDFLKEMGAVKIPDGYFHVLAVMLKRDMYLVDHPLTPEVDKYFELKIRSKVIQLLESGDYVYEPGEYPVEKAIASIYHLNAAIEKIDLGRRSDLNFSNPSDTKVKLGRPKTESAIPADLDEEAYPIVAEYFRADEAKRKAMRNLHEDFLDYLFHQSGQKIPAYS